jgi:hypothetical protein
MHNVPFLICMFPWFFFIMGYVLGQRFGAWRWRYKAKVMEPTMVHQIMLIESLTKQNLVLQFQIDSAPSGISPTSIGTDDKGCGNCKRFAYENAYGFGWCLSHEHARTCDHDACESYEPEDDNDDIPLERGEHIVPDPDL